MIRNLIFNHNKFSFEFSKKVLSFYSYVKDKNLVEGELYKVIEYSLSFFNEKGYFPTIEEVKKEINLSNLFFEFEVIEDFESSFNYIVSYYRNKRLEKVKILLLSEKNLDKIREYNKELNELLSYSFVNSYYTPTSVDIKALYSKYKESSLGFQTSIKEVDEIIYGVSLGRGLTVAAPPKSGKTVFGVNYVIKNLQNGYKILVLTLELSKEQYYINLISRYSYDFDTPIKAEFIRKARLSEKEENNLFLIESDFKDKYKDSLLIIGREDFNIVYAEDIIFFLKEIYRVFPFDGLVLDYVQLAKFLKSKNRNSSSFEVLNTFVVSIRDLAVSTPFSFLLLAQVNRTGIEYISKDSKKKKLFGFHHLAEVNELERASDYIIFLRKDPEQLNEVWVQFDVNRWGEIIPDTFTTFFDPAYFVIGKDSSVNIYDSSQLDSLMSDFDINL